MKLPDRFHIVGTATSSELSEKIEALCRKLPDGLLLTSRELCKRLGLSYSLVMRSWQHDVKEYCLRTGGRLVWGNKKTIRELKAYLEYQRTH